MEKIELTQKAIELHQTGYSYGEIAKQLETPKSTVYRWINDPETDYETPEMPIGTENETDLMDFETSFGTNNQDYRNDHPIRNDDSSEIEIRKVELEHEYKMEELEFRKQQYFEKQKLDQKREDVVHLQKKINEVIEEVDDLKEHNQELTNQLESKALVDNENHSKVIPREIFIKFNKLIKKYFSLDEKLCTENMIQKLHSDAQEIRITVLSWANKNNIAFSDIYDLKYFNELLKDIGEAWKGFEEDSDEEYLLKFDPSFKKKIKRWIKEKLSS